MTWIDFGFMEKARRRLDIQKDSQNGSWEE